METIILLTNELQGHIELKAGKEAVQLARRILASKRITVQGFNCSIDALTLFANHLPRWKRRVESAYSRLKPADSSQVRSRMFDFYVASNHWDDAARFMPAKPTTAHELMFKVWTLLELRRVKEAQKAIRLFVKRWRVETAMDEACLAEAVASCLAQSRSWEDAESVWRRGCVLGVLADNAWSSIVQLHALRGLVTANEVFDLNRERRQKAETALMLGQPSPDQPLEDLEADLRVQASHLAKVIPAAERWRFGL